MKNLKRGFTLAEVVGALVIVGVIAAATLPMTISGLQRQKTGPSVGKAVQQIEIACQDIISKANSNLAESGAVSSSLDVITHEDLFPNSGEDGALTERNIFLGVVEPFMGLSPIQNGNLRLLQFDGSNYNFNNASYFRLNKQQIGVYFGNFNANAGNSPTGRFVEVCIDANAESSPNTLGEDVYLFYLTNAGKLVPHGLDNDDHYTVNCSDDNIADGLACAARLVADGYRKNF